MSNNSELKRYTEEIANYQREIKAFENSTEPWYINYVKTSRMFLKAKQRHLKEIQLAIETDAHTMDFYRTMKIMRKQQAKDDIKTQKNKIALDKECAELRAKSLTKYEKELKALEAREAEVAN